MDRREILKQTAIILGYAVSGSAITGILNGCKADKSDNWQPQFFSTEEIVTIGEIAEFILPKTTTPGAKDLLVHRFIDKIIAGSFNAKEQSEMKEGTRELENYIKAQYNTTFWSLTNEQRSSVITYYESRSAQVPPNIWGSAVGEFIPPPFYRKLKELILLGYYSSEEIGEKVLNYQPIPGSYHGCVPVAGIGNSWTL